MELAEPLPDNFKSEEEHEAIVGTQLPEHLSRFYLISDEARCTLSGVLNGAQMFSCTRQEALEQQIEISGAILDNVKSLVSGFSERDFVRIERTIIEFIVNAAKYGKHTEDEEGSVTVSYGSTGDEYIISIANDGTGYDPRNVPDCTTDFESTHGRGHALANSALERCEAVGDFVMMPHAEDEAEIRTRQVIFRFPLEKQAAEQERVA